MVYDEHFSVLMLFCKQKKSDVFVGKICDKHLDAALILNGYNMYIQRCLYVSFFMP